LQAKFIDQPSQDKQGPGSSELTGIGSGKCAVANKALDNFKARFRQLTRRAAGCCMEQVVQGLRPYLLGWKGYFRMAQTPSASWTNGCVTG
jgi:hypothetical protein